MRDMLRTKQPRDKYIAQLTRFSYVYEEDLETLLDECRAYGIAFEDTRDYDGCIAFEDIEKYIKDALIKSSIGTAIQNAINSILASSYDNPIKKQLEKVIAEIAMDVIQEKFTDDIKTRISTAIETMVTDEMLGNLTKTALTRMERSLRDGE